MFELGDANLTKLYNFLETLRSKNASPCWLTLDMIFKDFETYEKIKRTKILDEELFTKLYGVRPIVFLWFDPGRALKVTFKRRRPNGNIGDPDVFGCGQHAPLYDIEIPLK